MGSAQFYRDWEPRILAVFRIVFGLLFLEHGTGKFLGFPHLPQADHLQLLSMSGIGGVLELVGGFLIVIGLGTRCVAFVLCGEMAVAYFTVHFPRGFFPALNGGEPAVAYCFAFLYLWFAGGGAWSVDKLLQARAQKTA